MLTREQVLALTGREFDAAVAEHVFEKAIFRRHGVAFLTGETGLLGNLTPLHYHANADADYTVLAHVRETWGERAKRFLDELGAVLANRKYERSDLTPRWGGFTLHLMEVYRPGDYARAALLTLSTKE